MSEDIKKRLYGWLNSAGSEVPWDLLQDVKHAMNRIEELEAELAEQVDWVRDLADELIEAEQRAYANAMEAERKLTDQICAEWAETSQRNYQCAKKYYEALETIARPQYGLQSIMEDYPDTDSKESLEATMKYYQSLVYRFQKIAREAIAGVENDRDILQDFVQNLIDEIIAMRGPTDIPRTEKSIVYDDACDRCIEIIKEHTKKHAKA